MGLGYEVNPETGTWYEKADGFYDKAFAVNGNEPCGFDIFGSPWSEITMADYHTCQKSKHFYKLNSKDACPYTTDIKISQLFDGIVFIKPAREFKGGTLIDIYTPDFIEICRQRSGGYITTPIDFLKQVHKYHPHMKLPE